jgi:hypothetical protein
MSAYHVHTTTTTFLYHFFSHHCFFYEPQQIKTRALFFEPDFFEPDQHKAQKNPHSTEYGFFLDKKPKTVSIHAPTEGATGKQEQLKLESFTFNVSFQSHMARTYRPGVWS